MTKSHSCPGAKPHELSLQLRRGFETQVRVVDENGDKVSGIDVDVDAWHYSEGGGSTVGYQKRTLPIRDGVVELKQLNEKLTYALEVRGGEWEFSTTKLRLKPGETPTWKIYGASKPSFAWSTTYRAIQWSAPMFC